MAADGELYVLGPGEGAEDGEEWVSPRPVDEVVVDVLTDATGLSADDLDDLETYVDHGELATHLDGDRDGPLSFEVEGHDVVVAADGTVDVDPE